MLDRASGAASPRLLRALAGIGAIVLVGLSCEEALVYDEPDGFSDISLQSGELPDTVVAGQIAIARAAMIDSATGGRVVEGPAIQWTSSDTSVIRIVTTPEGDSIRFEARRPGTATVTASVEELPYRSESHAHTLTVVLAGIALPHADSTMTAFEDTVVLSAAGLGVSATVPNAGLLWTLRGTGALQRVGTGPADQARFVAVGAGTDTVEVTHSLCQSACTEEVVITVAQAPHSLSVAKDTMRFDALGMPRDLEATVLDRNGNAIAGADESWALQNPADSAIVSLSPSGAITARDNGSARAVATYGTLSAAVDVAVAQVPASLALDRDTISFDALGLDSAAAAVVHDRNSRPIVAPGIVWSSDDESVATVDANGVIRSEGPGTTPVVATAGTRADTVIVRVQQIVAFVELSEDSVRFDAIGDSHDLDEQPLDANHRAAPGGTRVWYSNDTGVVEVNPSGVVSAIGPGSTFVVVEVDGARDTAWIVVSQVVDAVGITMSPTTLTSIGQAVDADAIAVDHNQNAVVGRATTWSSETGSVASVSGSGLVTALAEGATRIIAEIDGVADTIDVTVDQVVVNVDLAPDSLSFNALGESAALNLTALDAGGTPASGDTTWLVRDELVATVTQAGVVTSAGVGNTYVVARVDAAEDSIPVRVRQDAVALELSRTSLAFTALDDTAHLAARALDGNGQEIPGSAVTWATRDAGVADVDAAGVVTAMGVGSTWIVAAGDGVTDSAQVAVTQTVTDIEIDSIAVSFASLGETRNLGFTTWDRNGNVAAGTPVWTALNGSIASVNAAGVVTARANGQTSIIATIDGVADTAIATVDQVVTTVRVEPDSTEFTSLTDSLQLGIAAFDARDSAATGTATWLSRDGAIASVSPGGMLRAEGLGTAWVVGSVDGVADSVHVRVRQAVVLLDLVADTIAFAALADTATIQYDAFDSNSDPVPAARPAWTSRDEGVATVDVDGLVTAIGTGTTWIVGAIDAGVDSLVVTVTQVVTGVAIEPAAITLDALGDTAHASAEPQDANGHAVPAAVAWASRDEAVATVDSAGVVTALGNGATWLVATADGVSDSVAVTVHQIVTAVELTAGVTTFTRQAEPDTVVAVARDANGVAVQRSVAADWSIAPADVFALTVDGGTGLSVEVAPIGFGSATLTVDIEGVTDEVELSFVPTTLEVLPASDTLTALDQNVQLTATLRDADGAALPGSIAWSTSDALIAEVSATGIVTARANGSADIVATYGALADTSAVLVQQAVSGLAITPTSAAVVAGGEATFTARPADANGFPIAGAALLWTSGDETVATVVAVNDTQAVATAQGFGSTSIEVSSNGRTATATFAVSPFAVDACDATGTSHSGTIVASETWAPAGNPHKVTTNFNVQGAAILTIQPGTLVCVSPNVTLNFQSGGRLNARGDSNNPIAFRRAQSTGIWGGLNFSGAPPSASTLRNASIEFASIATSGSHVLNADTLVIQSGGGFTTSLGSRRSRITESQITGGSLGIYIYADSVTVSGVDITGTTQTAIRFDNPTTSITLRRIRAVNNSGTGIHLTGQTGVLLDTVLVQGTGDWGIGGPGGVGSPGTELEFAL